MVALYALKSVICGTGFENRSAKERITSSIWAVISVSFTVFMLYGAGLKYLLFL